MMRLRIALGLFVGACLAAHAGETAFEDILARVSHRNPTTKAIMSVDQHRKFKLEIKGDQAEVTIWTHMKVRDPEQETHFFPLSGVVRQEHARLEFQDVLNRLSAKCAESERQFRISQYKMHPIRAGMPYDEAKELLKNAFKPDGMPRAEMGAYRLESDTHSIVFQYFRLVDVVTKETSGGARPADGQ